MNGQKQAIKQDLIKVPCDVLPPDNNTGFCYDHQGVVKYAKENGKSVSDLSEAEKKRFLREKSL